MNEKKITVFAAYVMILSLCSFSAPSTFQEKDKVVRAENSIVYNKKSRTMTLSWVPFGSSGDYTIERGGSRLASNFVLIGTTSGMTFTDGNPIPNKYENYYKITRDSITILLSLEKQIFGDNVYFYDRKYEEAGTARREINAHFATTGRGGANGEWSTKRQAE